MRNPPPASVDVILPLYRTEPFARELVSRIGQALSVSTTIIAVDDASPDLSSELVQRAAHEAEIPCRIIVHDRNLGQHQSMLDGLQDSASDLSVVMDADLQDPPEVIPALLDKLTVNEPGIVFAQRTGKHGSWHNELTSALFKWLIFRRLKVRPAAAIGMFFALTRQSRQALLRLPRADAYVPAMLLALRHPLYYSEYQRGGPTGPSGYSFRTRVDLALRANRWVKTYMENS